MAVEPLYTGELRGKRLRFFRRPDGEEDLPWHSFDDLLLAAGLPRNERRYFAQCFAKDRPIENKVVDTDIGLTTIGPHAMAQGLIAAMTHLRHVDADFEMDFVRTGAQAMAVLTAHIPDPVARFQFTMRCARRAAGTGEAA